ncbi:SulP family sulfate permease [Luteococcus japonicus]|uniref:SulP family sulfate permease n=1 Tax=Luteococcus japonicus TaxID=33984 RepID=A0A3N2A0G9_9ACTN|nr:sulfate permease [Luteococcus japonicus]ROR55942.1 SulP family sulfate permease [Luteococcus japonicus]
MEGRQPAWARVLPGLDVLAHYRREWLRGDVLGGITVAAYLVPQVMAYAVVAGLPPVAGLWASGVPLVVYALMGSSRQLSVGPESTTALMTAAGVAALAGQGAGHPPDELAAALAFAVGLVCLAGYLLRLGFLAALLSRPVLVGYMSGVAVMMITSQLGKVSRLGVQGERPDQEIWWWITHLGSAHRPTLALALLVLVLLFAARRLLPTWPGPLLVMVAAALVVWLADLQAHGIRTIGAVPAGLPRAALPSPDGLPWGHLFAAALGIALVGYSDNVLTARAFAARHRQDVDANQEFLALGLANLATAATGGFPVSSSGSRTVLADSMGARSQLHSLVSAVMLLVVMFWLAPLLAWFPAAALGAVVVYAAIRLVDVAEWRRVARFRRSELVLALVTTMSVLGFGVLNGIGVAIVLSLLDLLRRLAHPNDGVLGEVPGMAGMHDVRDYEAARQIPGLVVYRYDSPLFFANADDFAHRAQRAAERAPQPVHWFLLNAEANVVVDLTAVDELDQLRERLEARGIVFAMARVKQDLFDQLERAGFVEKVGPGHVFPTLPTAVAGYREWLAASGRLAAQANSAEPTQTPSTPSEERG